METITVTQIRDDVNLDQHNNGDGKNGTDSRNI